jgi:hypothetical protein
VARAEVAREPAPPLQVQLDAGDPLLDRHVHLRHDRRRHGPVVGEPVPALEPLHRLDEFGPVLRRLAFGGQVTTVITGRREAARDGGYGGTLLAGFELDRRHLRPATLRRLRAVIAERLAKRLVLRVVRRQIHQRVRDAIVRERLLEARSRLELLGFDLPLRIGVREVG